MRRLEGREKLCWRRIVNAGVPSALGQPVHRSLGLVPPNSRTLVQAETIGQSNNVRPRDRLGGLLHEYDRVA
jgi:hypothetical protein